MFWNEGFRNTTSETPHMTSTQRFLALNGAHGRMGTRISALADAHQDVTGITAIDRGGKIGADGANFSRIDAVIDFSSPEGVNNARQCARQHNCALLVGTTGLSDQQLNTLKEDARDLPVMIAPNTSLGVAVLRSLVQQAAARLGDEFQVGGEIFALATDRQLPSADA